MPRSRSEPESASPPAGENPLHRPLVIGWKERIDFPDWHINSIVAKSDTGARTGALDVTEVEELPGNKVRFAVRLQRRAARTTEDRHQKEDISRHIEAPIVRRSRVRSAFGHAHDRLFIETTVRIGPVTKKVELGLVSRKKMICRVLLGRKALDGDFLVDSGHRYVFGRRKTRHTVGDIEKKPRPSKKTAKTGKPPGPTT